VIADRQEMRPLANAVDLGAEADRGQDLGNLLPVLLPSTFVEDQTWSSPFAILRAPVIAQTWAVVLPDGGIQYVDARLQREWQARGVDWKAHAIRNLHDRSPEPLGTGALFRDSGETWLISLMYPDGLGPSRLLLTGALERIFPGGYQIAIPECTRAFAFARQLDREDRDTIENLVLRSFTSSKRPLSSDIFEPEDLMEAARRPLAPDSLTVAARQTPGESEPHA
jgi:hypothetical protein